MCTALNTCVAAMRLVLGTVAQGAENLSASATEMSVRSVQANANAQAQSGKTNQIAAAAQEMTATIGEISRNAETASNISRKSAETASEGGAVMQTAAQTMERISSTTSSVAGKMTGLAARSEEIGKVVTVIQDISEQTNLLALNAAIEAARAGDPWAWIRGCRWRGSPSRRAHPERYRRDCGDHSRHPGRNPGDAGPDGREPSGCRHGHWRNQPRPQTLAATIESAREVEHMIRLIATAATQQTSAAGEISESRSAYFATGDGEFAHGGRDCRWLQAAFGAGERSGRHHPAVPSSGGNAAGRKPSRQSSGAGFAVLAGGVSWSICAECARCPGSITESTTGSGASRFRLAFSENPLLPFIPRGGALCSLRLWRVSLNTSLFFPWGINA